MASASDTTTRLRSPQSAIQDCRALLENALCETRGDAGAAEIDVISLKPSWVRQKDREHRQAAMRETELMAKVAQRFLGYKKTGFSVSQPADSAQPPTNLDKTLKDACTAGSRPVREEAEESYLVTQCGTLGTCPLASKASTLVEEAVVKACVQATEDTGVSPPLISMRSPGSSPRPRSPKHVEFSNETTIDGDLATPLPSTDSSACSSAYDADVDVEYIPLPEPQDTGSREDTYGHSSSYTGRQMPLDVPPKVPSPLATGLSESPKCLSVLVNSRRCLSDQGINGLDHWTMPLLETTAGFRNPAAERAYQFALESSKFERRVEDFRQQHQALTGILKSSPSPPPDESACIEIKPNPQRSVHFAMESPCQEDASLQGREGTAPDHMTVCTKCSPEGSGFLTANNLDVDPAIVMADLARFPEEYKVGYAKDQIQHYAKTGAYLNQLFSHDQLVDTVIFVSMHSFSAHACVLAAHSSYIASQLLRNNVPGKRHEIALPNNVTPCAFKNILDFMYSGEISLSSENAAEVMSAAIALKMAQLQLQCRAVMDKITNDNVLLLWETAEQNGMTDLAMKPLQVASSNFTQVCQSRDFLLLTIERLCRLLSRDDLEIASELQVAEAGMRWIQHDAANRRCHVGRVLGCVRMCHMTSRELLDLACLEECVMANSEARQMILLSNWFISCQREGVVCQLKVPRSPARTPPCTPHLSDATTSPLDLAQLVKESVAEGRTPVRGRRSFQSLSSGSSSSSMASCSSGPILIDKFKYEQNRTSNNRAGDSLALSVDVDITTDECTKSELGESEYTTSQNQKHFQKNAKPDARCCVERCEPRSSEVGPQGGGLLPLFPVPLFVLVGGYDPAQEDAQAGSSLYTLNMQTNQWGVHECRLPEMRAHHAAVYLDSAIYVIGGCYPHQPMDEVYSPCNSMYRLHAETGEWQQMASMESPRMNLCACALGGKIYAIGGQDDSNVLLSVECYDPDTNTWQYVCPTLAARFGASAVMLGEEEILLTGGSGPIENGDQSFVIYNSVEVYSPIKDRWRAVQPLRIPRCYSSLVRCQGRIFLCGGITHSMTFAYPICTSLRAIDEYDAINDTWQQVAELDVPRHHVATGALGDRIYIVGGLSTLNNMALFSMECYNVVTQCWEHSAPNLPHALLAPQGVVLS